MTLSPPTYVLTNLEDVRQVIGFNALVGHLSQGGGGQGGGRVRALEGVAKRVTNAAVSNQTHRGHARVIGIGLAR